MGWLKAEAHQNIADILVTTEVFQSPMGWLKARPIKHCGHIGNDGSIPVTDGLVEGGSIAEHVCHNSCRRSVPVPDWLIEGSGGMEHSLGV